jgi:hypothetical protein
MSLREIPVPDAIEDVFKRTLSHLPELSEGVVEAGPWNPGDLALFGCRRIFTLGLPGLQAGEGLSSAREIGWLLLARHQSGTAVTFEVAEESPGKPDVPLATVSWGPAAEEPVEATEFLKTMAEDERLRVPDFEVRILRLPFIHVEAIWLHASADQGDFAIPFMTYLQQWSEQKGLLAIGEFAKMLQTLAVSLGQPRPIQPDVPEYGKDQLQTRD